jgi:hypothetical protein
VVEARRTASLITGLIIVAGASCSYRRIADLQGMGGAGGQAGAAGGQAGAAGGQAGAASGQAGAAGGQAGVAGQAGAASQGGGAGGGAGPCTGVTALPTAPILAGPKNGAYTGSLAAPAAFATLRPTFRWRSVPATCGELTYHLQADDSCLPGALDTCAFPSPELDATGLTDTRHTPTTNISIRTTPPVGALYAWRVRACDGAQRCGHWSTVRYLHVGRVREDINGDGFGDLLATSSNGSTGRIEVYFGGPQFNVSAASGHIDLSPWQSMVFVGDIDGDGYGDAAFLTGYAPSSGAVPVIAFGGPNLQAVRSLALTKQAGGPSTLMQVRPAGDFNGDGFADLIVQWGYGITSPPTQLRLYYGNSTLAATADLLIDGPFQPDYSLQDSGRIGDANGDGFEDIALFAFDGSLGTGVMQIFLGGKTPNAAPDASVAIPPRWGRLGPAGDVNGDGFDDAFVVQETFGYSLYAGAASLPNTLADAWTDPATISALGDFDINRDGYADFFVSLSAGSSGLHAGSQSTPAVVSDGLSRLHSFRYLTVADHDGDGRPDFAGGRASETGSIVWLGSDGSTNPRAFNVLTSDSTFPLSGYLVQ